MRGKSVNNAFVPALSSGYNRERIRTLLEDALGHQELHDLLADHYLTFYKRFQGENDAGLRRELVMYCETRASINNLLSQIEQINPVKYSEYKQSLSE